MQIAHSGSAVSATQGRAKKGANQIKILTAIKGPHRELENKLSLKHIS